jgi:hypothetical protein
MNRISTSSFNALFSAVQACRSINDDLTIILPEAFERDPSSELLRDMLIGAATLGELRFSALLETYTQTIRSHGHFCYHMEDAIMQAWCACDDLRCAYDGAHRRILDSDALSNALLGIQALFTVRHARLSELTLALNPDASSSL